MFVETQKIKDYLYKHVLSKRLTPLDLNRTNSSCHESPRVHAETKFAAHVVLKDSFTHVRFLSG